MTTDGDPKVPGLTPSGALIYHPSEEVRREREQRWLACQDHRRERRQRRTAEELPAQRVDAVSAVDMALLAERVAIAAVVGAGLLAVVSLALAFLALVIVFGS